MCLEGRCSALFAARQECGAFLIIWIRFGCTLHKSASVFSGRRVREAESTGILARKILNIVFEFVTIIVEHDRRLLCSLEVLEMKGYFSKSMTVFVMVFVVLSGCGTRTVEVTQVRPEESCSSAASEEDFYFPDESADSGNEAPDLIKVFVCGAVEQPGVYSVPAGSRLFEAIGLAGGMRADADPDYLNQARVLTDGEQIRVPTRAETEGMEAPPAQAASVGGGNSDGKVNINTADIEELQTLSGIGEARAKAIISYRETNGAFERIEEIMNVSGIKTALFNTIKDDITVS